MKLHRLIAGLALGLAAATAAQAAAPWPVRPIRLIATYGPGSSIDIIARLVAKPLSEQLGQTVIVENKPGAGGDLGTDIIAKAEKDGYTIGFVVLPGMNTVVIDPNRRATFTEESFIPVANQVLDPGVLWVKADSPFKTFKDLIEAARKAPYTVRAATTGILSDDHLNVLMTEEANPGTFFRLVHLDGSAVQLKETLGGNVDVAFDNVGGAIKPVKAGQARALMITDTVRSKFLPDVPTSAELGFPTILSNSTRGITAPKGTPPEIVAKLAEILSKAMADPEHNRRLEDQGLTVRVMVGEEYKTYYKNAHEKARKYVAWAKARPQK